MKIDKEDLLILSDFLHRLECDLIDIPEEVDDVWEKITVILEEDGFKVHVGGEI